MRLKRTGSNFSAFTSTELAIKAIAEAENQNYHQNIVPEVQSLS
jgi:hypothetical protein